MYEWFSKAYKVCELDLYQNLTLDAQLNLFHTQEFLQRNLKRLDQLITKDSSADSGWRYDLAQRVLKRLDIMKELGASSDEIRQMEREYWNLPEVRQRVVERLLAAGQTDDAIALLQESKQLDKELVGLVSQYSAQLISLYQENHREAELLEELTFQVFECSQRSLDYVKLLKAQVPVEGWPELLEKLLSSRTLSRLRGELLESEGLYERLLQYVIEQQSLGFLDRWERVLKPRFPEQLRDIYRARLNEQMEQASSRKRYAEVVSYLKKLTGYPDGKQLTKELAEQWREAYRRRSSMLDELRKAGY